MNRYYYNGITGEPLSDNQTQFVEFELRLGMEVGLLVPGENPDDPHSHALGTPEPDGSVRPAAVANDEDPENVRIDVYIEYPSDDELAEMLHGQSVDEVLSV